MSGDSDPEAIKIILIGDSGTGKTNLITVAAGYEFNSNTLTTRACSYIQKKYTLHNAEYKVNVWDTIGQEKYRSLTKIFVKESKIVVFVYDITNKNSFESLPFWKKIVDELLNDSPVLGIVGNKMDLYVDEQIKSEEVEKYAQEIGAKLLLTSAKTDSTSFSNFLGELLQDYLHKGRGERIESFSLNKQNVAKKKKCC
jgi:small GTP-binding protein